MKRKGRASRRGRPTAPRCTAVMAGALVLLASGASGQASVLGEPPPDPPPDGGLSVRLEVGRLIRRDDRASPMAYSGLTWRGGMAYVRPGRVRVKGGLTFGTGTLTSPLTDDWRPRETVYEARLSAGLTTRVPWLRWSSGEVRVGAVSSLESWYSVHAYDDPNRTQHAYGMAVLALGSAVEARIELGSGVVDAGLGMPLVGVVSRPYSDVRVGAGRIPLEVLTSGGGMAGLGVRVGYWRPAGWGAYGVVYRMDAGALTGMIEQVYVRHALSVQATLRR